MTGDELVYVRLPEDSGNLLRRVGLNQPLPTVKVDANGTPANGETELETDPWEETKPDAPEPALIHIVPLLQFATTSEDVKDPLLGTQHDSLLPDNGLLLLYGDGGAGKTTLSIDAVAHLASGTEWLGIPIPKPLRILLIENEGPRGPFRTRIQEKIDTWQGKSFHENVSVLEEPWSRFTLTNRKYREAIASSIDQLNINLVVVGPLASLGAKGTGTPDEINEFDGMILDLRSRTQNPFGLWIVHHENKSGDVSGAWERYPDSLVQVQGLGNGMTRILWRKVRWSSTLHGTHTDLTWSDDGHGFQLVEKKTRDLSEIIIDWLQGKPWSTAREIGSKETGISASVQTIKPILSRLTDSGILEYAEGRNTGRSNANAKCWRIATYPPETLAVGSGGYAKNSSETVSKPPETSPSPSRKGGEGSGGYDLRKNELPTATEKTDEYSRELDRLEKLYGTDPTETEYDLDETY